jgi:ubiquinone/menaquinone biosynthesis C-methylase UbiE
MNVLDVGCGPGTITVDLARRVSEGHVTGLDTSSQLLHDARVMSEDVGVNNVDFVKGDIHQLPFADETF